MLLTSVLSGDCSVLLVERVPAADEPLKPLSPSCSSTALGAQTILNCEVARFFDHFIAVLLYVRAVMSYLRSIDALPLAPCVTSIT